MLSFCTEMSALSQTPTMPHIDKEVRTSLRKPVVSAKKIRYPFWFGGSAASMAAVVTHPLDLSVSNSCLSKLALQD